MCCKDNLKKLLSFVLAFLLGLVAATILQNEKIASKNQEIVKTNTKTIWREQGTGFSGNGGSGNSGRSNRKTTLPPFFSPKVSENSSSEIKLKIISKPKQTRRLTPF